MKIFMFKYYFAVFIVIVIYLLNIHIVPANKASAGEGGGDIIFSDTKKQRQVLFSHEGHQEAGNKCADCHPQIFQQEKGSSDEGNALTMKSMRGGKFCGACHNGKDAFKVMSSCKKCHFVAR